MITGSMTGRELFEIFKKDKPKLEQNDDLSKLYDDIDKDRATRRIISYFYLYKYLNAQNDVDFCKRKINCTDYLSKKRWLEFMIETYTGILKERGQNV